ncbi:DUF4440 domain-containing protein [Kocuria polaris]|nr:DUF4440 domain-containing protein [Kocuria polaris]
MTIIAAADGSALGNPGPAGWAWYIDDANWRAGGWDHGTNNMGELMAVLDLLQCTAHRADEPLHILCDSQYVINSVTKWMPGWKKKGWKKKDGKPVLNVELLKQIDAALAGRTYEFEWVKGHAGHDLNEAADVRARAAATAHQRGVAPEAGPGLAGGAPAAPRSTTTAAPPAAPPSPPAAAEEAEPDLFSSLEDVQESGTGNAALDAVVTLERELLEPEVRADASAVSYLLHADFRQIGSRGNLHDRDTAIAVLEESAAAPAGTFELLDASPVADTVMLTYRLSGAGYATIVASLWVQADGRWRLRFRQSTPER